LSFVAGFLIATAPLYAVTVAIGLLLISNAIFAAADAQQLYVLTILLQVAIGVLLIFTSYAIIDL
jgi:hypothetical protein